MTIGFDKPLYVLPFDHRATFQTKMFGWKGTLTPTQSEEITAAKRVIYDGFKAAVAAGVPKEKAASLFFAWKRCDYQARILEGPLCSKAMTSRSM